MNKLIIALLILIILCALYYKRDSFPYFSGKEVMRDELIQMSED